MIEFIDDLRIKSAANTRLLWHSCYYDGPIDGIMLWENKKSYYKMYNEEFIPIPMTEDEKKEWENYCKFKGQELKEKDCFHYDRTRYYNVYQIEENILKEFEARHVLFCQYVGTHTSYDKDGHRSGSVHSEKNWYKYYKEVKEPIEVDLKKCILIGKFKI